jgi:diguanylate cyclase (GGDEF)-like protein
MRGGTGVEVELRRRLLMSTQMSLFAAPLGVASLFGILGGSLSSFPQMIWAVTAASVAVGLTVLAHFAATSRINPSMLTLRLAFGLNPVVAQTFLLVFDTKLGSREDMLETLAAIVICLTQIVTFSADRVLCRVTLLWSMLMVSLGATAINHFSVGLRLLAMIPIGVTLMQMFEAMNRQQRRNIELNLENLRLIEELRSANQSLGREIAQDPLTGLANRVGLSRALEHDRAVGLLFVDVDDFKSVNDTHGHAMGDSTLQTIGDALVASVRPNDVVSRTGGDEFVIVLDGAVEAETVQIGERICREVRDRLCTYGITVSVGATSGVIGEETPATILARADSGLYRAKHLGGDRLELANT